LVTKEDPVGDGLASVLAQEGVDAEYSGALLTAADGEVVIEGVKGRGDEFMQGRTGPGELPANVTQSLRDLCAHASAQLGPVRLEWVHDGQMPWVVQLHCGISPTAGDIIYPGKAAHFIRFNASEGLEALRALIERVLRTGEGVTLVGQVGVTSHMGDVLRRAGIPSRLDRNQS
jgi:hypothetical protein